MTEPEDTRPVINITTEVDFLAAIPSIVGLVPSQDLITVAFTETAEMVCCMRVGTRVHEEYVDQMLDVVDEQAHTVIAVIVDADFDVAGTIGQKVAQRLDTKLRGVYAMPTIEPGSRWVELSSGRQGHLTDYTTTDLAMLNTLDGKTLFTDPSQIEDMYKLSKQWVEPVAFAEPTDLATAMECMADAVAKRETVPAALVGGVLTFGESVRDEILNIIEIDAMDAHNLFATASRDLRGVARVEALTAAGIAAYIGGEGLYTAAALDAAFETANQFGIEANLANLISQGYHRGMHPNQIRELIIREGVRKIRDNN